MPGRQQRELVRVHHRRSRRRSRRTRATWPSGSKVQHCCSRWSTSVGRSCQGTSVTSSVKREPRIVTTSGTKGSKNHFSCVGPAGALVEADELAELLPRLDAELDAAVPQHLAGLALVDLGVHVQRGEQRVERRRGRVHQERLVEALVLDVAALAPDVLVALVDLRGLREARALLVHRLGGEQPRHLGLQVREPHRAVVLEQRMERVVADPGLVPQHVVAQVPDLLQHLADVVDRAVVGRELDAGEPEGPLRLVPLGIL